MSDVLPALLRAPSGFKVQMTAFDEPELCCTRSGCGWNLGLDRSGVALTELTTLAVEHVQEAHR